MARANLPPILHEINQPIINRITGILDGVHTPSRGQSMDVPAVFYFNFKLFFYLSLK